MFEVNLSYNLYIAQRFIALHSIPAVPNSAVIWVVAMMSPMPKSSIGLMSRFGTVPRAPITTGIMAVYGFLYIPQMLDTDIS